jgi:hypothetical protein
MEIIYRNRPNTAPPIPILITSSIVPHDAGVKLSDPHQRLFHAMESIKQWARIAPECRLILCDGSNFDFSPLVKEEFPNAEVECLFFENDQSKIASHGRGYGEGEIIKFALRQSEFLRETDVFAKCSSKLWVENYFECSNNWQGNCRFSGVFRNAFSVSKPIEMVQVDTRFYIVQKDFYLSNLMDAHHQITLTSGFGLEDSFYRTLVTLKQQRYLFASPPAVMGVGGGTGTYYKSSWMRIFKEKIRLMTVKKSKKFYNLFN